VIFKRHPRKPIRLFKGAVIQTISLTARANLFRRIDFAQKPHRENPAMLDA
jgi:hypothetical protein